jgi:hypothetical protein
MWIFSEGLQQRSEPLALRRFSTGAERAVIAIVALLLLIPGFWQPHIIAGDLPSHIYNAWLAGQIEHGALQVPGLSVAHPLTNVLADWVMEALLAPMGRSATERIVVVAAVEIFFWGAFLFVAAVAGRRCWVIAPSLGMIAYGVIFQMGFLNFYISTGFSLGAMALLWRPRHPWVWLSIPLTVLALLAHSLPLAWAVGLLVYVHGLRRVPERRRWLFFSFGVCLLILGRIALVALFPSFWSLGDLVRLDGILGLTGTGQLWLYSAKYLIVVLGILIVWFFLFIERFDRGSIVADPIIHIWGLTLVAYIVLPEEILFPGYHFPIQFMHFRLSFFAAILFCAMVAGGGHGRALRRISAVVAAAFFTLLYLDTRSLNRLENELAGLVSQLPAGQRVVAVVQDNGRWRLNGLIHVASSICLGHCWDYANYEPATAQFRVRASGPNGIVAHEVRVVKEIELGEHIVSPEEAPLYTVCRSTESDVRFELKRLGAGEATCLVRIP